MSSTKNIRQAISRRDVLKTVGVATIASYLTACASGEPGNEAAATTPQPPDGNSYTNPIDIFLADPFVMLHDGVYYLYGTDDTAPNLGIPVFTSTNLVNWERHRNLALAKTDSTWGQHHFWGPEVFYHQGEFLMFYSASPNRWPDWPFNMHICAARSDSPLGPFTELKAPFYGASGGDEAIDQDIFVDDDGAAYIFLTIVTQGRNDIRVASLSGDLMELQHDPIICVRSTQEWESHAWDGHLVTEGVAVFKHQGLYYLTYTANHFLDPNYAIGYAVSTSPMGPWDKFAGNPILQKTDRIRGPGNGMFIPSPDGSEMFIAYHVHNSETQVTPRRFALDRARFVAADDGGPDVLVVDGPTHTPQPLPSGTEFRLRSSRSP